MYHPLSHIHSQGGKIPVTPSLSVAIAFDSGLNHQSTGRVSTSTLVDSTSTVDIVQLTTTLESTFSRGQIVSVGFTLVTSEQDLEEQLAGWHTDDESNHISSSSGINGVSSTISLGVEVVTTTTVSGSFIQSAEDSTGTNPLHMSGISISGAEFASDENLETPISSFANTESSADIPT